MKRRCKKKELKHIFTTEEWQQKLETTNGICPNPYENPLCLHNVGVDKLQLDHIVPISKAPKDFIYTIDNVQPLCKSCNSSKNDEVNRPIQRLKTLVKRDVERLTDKIRQIKCEIKVYNEIPYYQKHKLMKK